MSDATACNATGALNSGRNASGFSSGDYWSSSEMAGLVAVVASFFYGQQAGVEKSETSRVRPVRAFG